MSYREGTNGWAVHDLVHGNAQGMGDGRVKVRNGHGTFDDLFGTLGSLAVDITAFESTSGQNAGKSLRVVVSANVLVNEWSTAEFGRQDNDGVFQVWLNNTKVVDYKGATMYKDAEGYIKFGMYMNINDERIIYWDDIDIADHLTTDFETWLDSGDNGINPPDTSAPIFSSAATSTDGTKVILTYNEALSSTTAAASEFTIEVDGSVATISGVTTSGSTVELSLSSAVKNGQTVTVAYTDPSASNDSNAIQDAAGNDAATLSSTAVTNNSTLSSNTTTTLFASQDASIKEGVENLDGNWSNVEAYGGSTPIVALVEFDISGLSRKSISVATFRPYINTLKNNSSSTFSIYSTTAKEWDENSVEWSSRPPRDQLLDTITITGTGSYVDFDVTSAITAALQAGQSKVTLWIEDKEQEGEQIKFDSSTKTNKPELVVTAGADTTAPTFSSAATSTDGA